jgi:hypothetical protein
MFLLGLNKLICKDASIGPKKLGSKGKIGIKARLEFAQGS